MPPPDPGSRVTLCAPGEPHDGLSVIILSVNEHWFAWVAPGVVHPLAVEGHEMRGRSLWSEVAEACEKRPPSGQVAGAPDPPPGEVRTRGAVTVAKLNGTTGDICPSCGGANMVRSGSCATCLDCGGTSGCS